MLISLGVVVAVVLITVVSIFTGGQPTNASRNVLVGEQMKGFSLPGLDGGVETAPWTSGHKSVLIFFASWCGPCKAEMPKVAAYLRAHDPTPVRVMGVDVNDPRGAGRAFVKKDGFTYPVAYDLNFAVTSGVFGFGGIPETVFLNARGVVVQVYFGAIPEKKLAQGLAGLQSS